jgi:5-methylcytosine-specific restriction endonuclease McrA
MRNYDDLYKKFRQAVLKRDGHKCMFPGCKKKKKIQVHHIKKYASNPELGLEPSNGISLCKSCHGKVYGKEEQFELMFIQILCGPTIINLLKIQKGLR